jgi:hypothetical protein
MSELTGTYRFAIRCVMAVLIGTAVFTAVYLVVAILGEQ